MKKLLLSLGVVGLVVAVMAFAANVDNYKEQGGARWVIGGSLDVASGGDLDIESGGALKIAGTQVTASATELNLIDGVTATTNELNILDGVTSNYTELNYLDATNSDDSGTQVKHLIRSEFDFSVDGAVSGAYDLGEDLPANAIVTQNYFQIITQFADDGAGTVAIHCATANDLYSAADITGETAGNIIAGVATGVASTMFDVGGSACDLTVTLNDVTYSAGKLVHWVEYVISE